MPDKSNEYSYPEIYDAEYGSYQKDFNIFLHLKKEGTALDLACGTGRLTIALAKMGLKLIGIDLSESMLELARNKSQGLPILYLQGDIQDFHLSQKFDLITMAGNSFQALLTPFQQESMLQCVKKHLSTDGIFAFNTRNFREIELKTTDDFEFWHKFQDNQGNNVKVYGKQHYDAEHQIVTYTTKRVWSTYKTVTTIRLRFNSYLEIFEMLTKSGFGIIDVYGDFNKNPFEGTSPAIIILCRHKNY